MKKIMKIFVAAALVLTAASCVKENLNDGQNSGGTSENLVPMSITAYNEADTRASLQNDGKVFWDQNDVINVLSVITADDGAETVTRYEFTTTEGGASAEFTGLVDEKTLVLSEGMYGVYPATIGKVNPYIFANSGYSGFLHTVSSGVLNVFMPSTQFAADGGSNQYSLSVGKTAIESDDDIKLIMKNVGGLIKINLPAQDIKSVILYGNSGELLAGKVTAAFDEEGVPVVTDLTGSNMVRLIPKTEGDTFSSGTYYINVAPIVFSKGLTLLFTNSDNKYATLRSSAEFVVKRSMISEFPEIGNLTFGGKVLEISYSNDYRVDGGVGGKNTPLYRTGDTKDLPTSSKGALSGETVLTDGTNNYIVNADKLFVNGGYSGGICFGANAGSYFAIPNLDGFVLSKVAMRSGAYQFKSQGEPCLTTKPDVDGNYSNVPGCSKWSGSVQGGMEYIWSFAGQPNEEYALTLTSQADGTQFCRIQVLRLFYAEVTADRPSVNPLITKVSAQEHDIDYPNQKVTLKASFSAIDYSALSQFTCGFDYKLKSEKEWTSVSCSSPAFEFSADVFLPTAGEYEYRPWVQFERTDNTIKTVKGEVVSFDSSRLVLSLVFDDSYWDRTPEGENANYLVREWGWKTNQNTYSVWNKNGKEGYSYMFTYNGVDYPFNFWTVADLPKYDADGNIIYVEDENGDQVPDVYSTYNTCTLHAYGGEEVTRGLCLSYYNSSIHAWMQLPAIEKFRLTSITGDLYNSFTIEINDEVDMTSENTNVLGTPSGNKVAYQSGETKMDLSLTDSVAGVRYYFCSKGTRATIRNMTLTYEYAGE